MKIGADRRNGAHIGLQMEKQLIEIDGGGNCDNR